MYKFVMLVQTLDESSNDNPTAHQVEFETQSIEASFYEAQRILELERKFAPVIFHSIQCITALDDPANCVLPRTLHKEN